MKFRIISLLTFFILMYSCGLFNKDNAPESPKDYRILMYWSQDTIQFNSRIDSLLSLYQSNGFILENNVPIERRKGMGFEFNDPAPLRIITGYWNNQKAENELMNIPEYHERFEKLNDVLDEYVYFFGNVVNEYNEMVSAENVGFNLSYCDETKLDQYPVYLENVNKCQDSLGYSLIKTIKVTKANKMRPHYVNIFRIDQDEKFENTLNEIAYIEGFLGIIRFDIWYY